MQQWSAEARIEVGPDWRRKALAKVPELIAAVTADRTLTSPPPLPRGVDAFYEDRCRVIFDYVAWDGVDGDYYVVRVDAIEK